LERELPDDAWGWHTAKAVGERAGVSTTTARKYLKIMRGKRYVRCIGTHRAEFFQPIIAPHDVAVSPGED
jgi:hypothetical protein